LRDRVIDVVESAARLKDFGYRWAGGGIGSTQTGMAQ
jgi:hypothetical protein